jgi:hypothetical protein
VIAAELSVADATVLACACVIVGIVLALVVLNIRARRLPVQDVDETLAELRAAVDDLTAAATTAVDAADRIARTAPPPPPE